VLTKLFFPQVPGVRGDRVWREGETLHLAVRATRCWARCPLCQRRSHRQQSTYQRTLADLPCAGERVIIHLRVRRFVCRVRWCRRTIFAERLSDLVAPFARRTRRLSAHLLRTAFALGGEGGAVHSAAEGIPESARTLLRQIRAAPVPEAGPVREVGIDDWAHRKGRTYGTILVNLATYTVIDLLPDRSAETLVAWLRQHPELAVASRDRAGAYAEGIRLGAPQAVQIADRFHVRKNASEALERYLTRQHRALRQAATRPEDSPAALGAAEPEERPLTLTGAAADRRAWRLAR
jgi:transposase